MTEPSQPERREALARALHSDILSRSPKLSQLLRFICDEERIGRPDRLTEREIGVAIFGRAEQYDSSSDNIVRVQARNLRKRLKTYYDTAGSRDPVRIQIPKGHYLPEFIRRPAHPAATRALRRLGRRRAWTLVPAALALVALGFVLGRASWIAGEVRAAQQGFPLPPPWTAVLTPDQPTMLLVSDNTYSMSQRLLGRSLSLEEYLAGGVEYQWRARAVAPRELRRGRQYFDLIAWREQSSFTTLSTVAKLMNAVGPLGDQIELQFPRDLHARDLSGKNLILLGSRRSIPWVELFEDQMEFIYRYDEEAGAPYFVNRHPRAGEPELYRRGGPDGSSSETYSHVALMPSFDGDGTVLLLSGAGDAAQTALANHLLHPEQALRLLDEIGVEDLERPCCFEAILRSSRIHGTANEIEVMATRRRQDSRELALSGSR